MGENSVTFDQVGNYLKISFKGNLVYGSTKEIKDCLNEQLVVKEGYILDTTQVNDIDSTGFGVFVNTAKKVNTRKIAIIVNDDFIRELFDIAKFSMLFPIVPNLEEAIKALSIEMDSKLSIEEY